MSTENDRWKDRGIDALFDQLRVKDEQISQYQERTVELNEALLSMIERDENAQKQAAESLKTPSAALPWSVASLSTIMFCMLTLSYIKMRNEFINVSNEAVYLSERIDMQRDTLAQKSAAITAQRDQIVQLHKEAHQADQEVAQLEAEMKSLRDENFALNFALMKKGEQTEVATE